MVPVIKEMIANRRAMMDATLIEAEAKGWSLTKANNIYKNRILDVYKGIDRWRTSKGMMGKFVDAPFVTKDVHGRPIPKTINPWALKEYTWQDLPEADRWDSPNSGWTNKPPFSPQFDRKAQQFAKKRLHDEIRFHKAEIKRTGDPTGWHETAMLAKQYELKEGLY